jgi:hypothetical protein
MNQEVIATKKCSKCQSIKPINEFGKDKNRIDGYHCYCKLCSNNIIQKRRLKNPEERKIYDKKYLINNPEKRKESIHTYNIKNKHKKKEYNKLRYINNKDKILKINNTWYVNHPNYYTEYRFKNKNKIKNRRNKWCKNKRNNDFSFKTKGNVRTRIGYSIKKAKKIDTSVNILGISIKQYISFLQSLYYNNMTNNNQGSGYNKWQIHHICPIEFFDMTDPVEQKQAYHYSNTKPLWYEDHIEIHRKINKRMAQYENNGRPIYL